MLKHAHKFTVQSLYHHPVESVAQFLKKRWSFWLALFSCIAFLIGNMVGQHGFSAFWKSVWGKEDVQIVFTGTVSPLPMIPDPKRWAGDRRTHDYSDVPESLLIPLPAYAVARGCGTNIELDRSIYSVRYMGDYEGGGDQCGSHPGVDILIPKGTPVVAIANGVIERIEERTWGFGNTVVLRIPNAPDPNHPERTTTLYASYGHLGKIFARPGDHVAKGQQLGVSGQTGFATTPHLDFQIALESAPFKPFWTFTTTEATNAGLSFVDAVNQGLGRAKGLAHTVNPLLYIQQHQGNTAPPVIVAQEPRPQEEILPAPAQPTSRQPEKTVVEKVREVVLSYKERVRMKIAERRAARMARRAKRRQEREVAVVATEIALNEESPQLPAMETVHSTAEEVPMPKSAGDVSEITILHDGGFDRGWEQMTLFARDADGNFVNNVSFSGKLYLDTSFGTARFSPSVLSAEQFDLQGRAFVKMFVSGTKTIIPRVSGAFEATGEPLRYSPRERAVRRHARTEDPSSVARERTSSK